MTEKKKHQRPTLVSRLIEMSVQKLIKRALTGTESARLLSVTPRGRVGYELPITISYLISSSGVTVLLKTTTKNMSKSKSKNITK